MTAIDLKRTAQPMTAFLVATGVHVALAAGLVWMPRADITPPRAVGGFEVVDLSAFGAAVPAAPEPQKEVTEQVKTEPAPDPIPEPIPDPTPEPDPAPIAEPEPTPEPAPLPVAKPKPAPPPKPEAKPIPRPAPVRQAKVDPKPAPKPQPKPEPAPKPEAAPQTQAAPGSQNAFVPPSSTAAYLRNPKPSYPALAKRRGMQGVVLLYVEVAPDGRPLDVAVKKGSGYSILDKAALTAVRAWRFAPAMRGSTPVRAGVEVPIRFILNDA